MCYTILLSCFVILALAFTLYYIYGGHTSSFVRCRLKTISSLCFVCFGALAYGYSASSMYPMMMVGLGFGMLGDVLLDLSSCYPEKKQLFFLSGLTSFLLGHIAYATCFMNHMHWMIEIVVCLVLSFAMILLLQHLGCVFKEMTLPVYAYCVVIIFMVLQSGKCVYYAPSMYAYVIFLAALLFALSDFVLSFLLFQDRYHRSSLIWLNLTSYYAAQWLLATSMYLIL